MTRKIAWVTDSTASFSTEELDWMKKHHVFVVPLSVIFGKNTYKEGIDITTEEFYSKMSKTDLSPSTSQPTLGDFINLYEDLKGKYDTAVAIHVSGQLSGTYSTSVQAASIVGFPIHHLDSWMGSYPLKFIVRTGIELYNRGIGLQEIIETLSKLREKCRILLLPENLDQLRKSGRVSNFGSIVGNLLQIKPILAFKEGKVHVIERVRSYKKAQQSILSKFHESYEKGISNEISVLYAGEISLTDKIIQNLKENYQDIKIELTPLIPVAGVHTGIGTIGIAYIEK